MSNTRKELFHKVDDLSHQVAELMNIVQNPGQVTEQEMYEWDTQANNVINNLIKVKRDIIEELGKEEGNKR